MGPPYPSAASKLPPRWGEVHGAGGISNDDGVAVVRAWQAARCCCLVGVDAPPLFPGGSWRGGCGLEPSGSVDAYSLVDDLGCRWVHACIFVVPFVALREVAVHILEQVRLLWDECGPFHCLQAHDLGAAVFNRVGKGLCGGTAVFR